MLCLFHGAVLNRQIIYEAIVQKSELWTEDTHV